MKSRENSMFDIEMLHLELKVDHVMLFDFNGIVTQDSIVSIAKAVESTLLRADEDEARVRIIFELIVEVMQNILNYSADSVKIADNRYESKGAVLITLNSQKQTYEIHSGNHVFTDKVKYLKENLAEIDAIPMENVKDEYKQRRRDRRRVHSRGAGLGFLDMVRKSQHKLNYKFTEVDAEKVFFELTLNI